MKGKDWYDILAPEMFNNVKLAETPAIDPKMVIGRTIESNVAELTGQANNYYMNIKFKIINIEGNIANTNFWEFSCAKEHLFRIIRKRSQKVRTISNVITKDGVKLQMVSLAILNRNTDIEIQRKVRALIVEELEKRTKETDLNNLIRSISSGILQKEIRKLGNKIYPIRFSEIERIEVLDMGKDEPESTKIVKEKKQDTFQEPESQEEEPDQDTDEPKPPANEEE